MIYGAINSESINEKGHPICVCGCRVKKDTLSEMNNVFKGAKTEGGGEKKEKTVLKGRLKVKVEGQRREGGERAPPRLRLSWPELLSLL